MTRPIAVRLLAAACTVILLAVILAHHAPRILPFWAAMLRWPYPMQGSESLIVWEAQKLAYGESIYVANGPDRHGFVSGPYTPLYYAAVALPLKLTSTFYTGGRVITLAAWLVLLATVGLLAAMPTSGRNRFLGAAVAVLSLAVFTPGIIWAVRVKPTIPALALSLLGLYLVQRCWQSPHQRYLWALVPLVAAYYTKQTALAAPLAAALFLLIQAGWRTAGRFVALGLVGGAVPFGLLTLLTHGEFFRHIVSDHRLAWQQQLILNFGGLFLRDYWPLLVGAVLAAACLLWWRSASIAPYYLACALPVALMVGVEGADHDHLIELAAASALALGAGLAVALAQQQSRQWAALPLVVLLGLQAWAGWTPDPWYAAEYRLPDPQVRRQLDLIVTNIRHTPGDVLAEEIGLILMAGKPVPYDDPLTMAALSRIGRWDQQQLLDDIERRRFSLILLPANPRHELWTPEVLAAIRANYDLKFRDVWFTYAAK